MEGKYLMSMELQKQIESSQVATKFAILRKMLSMQHLQRISVKQ